MHAQHRAVHDPTVTMKTLKKRLKQEDGWLVLTAIVVTTMMLGIGLAIFSTVGTQQSMSRQERNRDTSFNLTESSLYVEAQILSKNWPYKASNVSGFASSNWTCTEATSNTLCPSASSIQSSLDTSSIPDLKSGAKWTITVRDNAGGTDYSPASTPSQASYDADGDQRLWVRADGVAQGKKRSIVALLQLEQFPEPFPKNVITAGYFHVEDSGNKELIDTQGTSATGSQVVVRCVQTGTPSRGSDCEGYIPDKGQVYPDSTHVLSVPTTPPAMTTSEIGRFMAAAQAAGTYYTTCPPETSTSLNGIVFIDLATWQTCSYTGKNTWNSATAPGLLIIRNGILNMGGTNTYYGLIYNPNPTNNTGYLVTTSGTGLIYGGIAVDGPGGVDIGASGLNLVFLGNAGGGLKTTGAAGLVQNTWRELPAGTQ